MTESQITAFRTMIWEYYHAHGRSMPWRDDPSPYHVVVSEFMLQQTQVSRVVPKFLDFVAQWPDWGHLARARQSEVLRAWKGLGYNRRALWIYEAAGRVMTECGGSLPRTREELVAFRGIGPNTAGAILAYAFEEPVVFIETNIRRVFLHHFFPHDEAVSDDALLPIVEAALDTDHPREWYWALMDYGSFLATQLPNPNRRSKHYARQSAFEGSHRQLRGYILECLLAEPALDPAKVQYKEFTPDDVARAVDSLLTEGFIFQSGGRIVLADEPQGEVV